MNETHTLHRHSGLHEDHPVLHHQIHASAGTVSVVPVWMFQHEPPHSGRQEPLIIQIDDEAGKPIESFQISHEKPMHLIMVSKDLAFFDHVHPEYQGQGRFRADVRFPGGGDYKLIVDFVPEGSEPLTVSHWVKVTGDVQPAQPLKPDSDLTKVVDGKEIALTFDQLQAGQEVTIIFAIHDANTKQPIVDLQPYLGAIGHVVALGRDAEHYLHIHPIDESASGPHAKFATMFPASGLYKLWGQFQHRGRLFTVPFTIQVP